MTEHVAIDTADLFKPTATATLKRSRRGRKPPQSEQTSKPSQIFKVIMYILPDGDLITLRRYEFPVALMHNGQGSAGFYTGDDFESEDPRFKLLTLTGKTFVRMLVEIVPGLELVLVSRFGVQVNINATFSEEDAQIEVLRCISTVAQVAVDDFYLEIRCHPAIAHQMSAQVTRPTDPPAETGTTPEAGASA